jgi:hypothetical protein
VWWCSPNWVDVLIEAELHPMIEVLTVMQMVAAARLRMVLCAGGGYSSLKFEAFVDSHSSAAESSEAEDSVPSREAHWSDFVTGGIVLRQVELESDER